MKRTALYAGTFDPLTNGHLNIIRRAAGMFDSLTVGIIGGSKKTALTMFERESIVRHVTEQFGNVEVDTYSGLLADYVNAHGFDAVIRGLRATTDFEYELQMAQMNARLFTGNTETVFLMTDPQYSYISSSLIKEVLTYGGDVHGLLPEFSEEMIKRKILNVRPWGAGKEHD